MQTIIYNLISAVCIAIIAFGTLDMARFFAKKEMMLSKIIRYTRKNTMNRREQIEMEIEEYARYRRFSYDVDEITSHVNYAEHLLKKKEAENGVVRS